jgi:hypothetical protein
MKLKFKVNKNPVVVFSYGKFYCCDNLQELEYVDDSNCLVVDIGNKDCTTYKNDFMELCKILKINEDMRYDYNNVIKYCLYYLMFDTDDFESVEKEEFDFISKKTYHDQIRYVDFNARLTRHNVKQLDVNSMFPSVMSTGLSIPTSKLKFKKINKIDMKTPIFFVRIKHEELPKYLYQKYNEKTTKWFSRFDLLILNKFNCKYEIIVDGDDNIAYYETIAKVKHTCLLRLFENRKENIVAGIVIKRIHGIAIMTKKVSGKGDRKMVIKSSCTLSNADECAHPKLYRLKAVLPCCKICNGLSC